jgi:hypothetical protein
MGLGVQLNGSFHLAVVKLWVQSPALQKKKKKTNQMDSEY